MAYPIRSNSIFQLFVCEPRSRARSALDLLNPRYSLHVIDALREGGLHVNALCRKVGASPNTVRQRIKVLEEQGIIRRHVEQVMPPLVFCELTAKGQSLAEVVDRIREWDRTWNDEASDKEGTRAAEARRPYGQRES